MGLEVVLEDEAGDRVGAVSDSKNILHRILPAKDDNAYRCLRYVDWYGDTVFNRQQMPDFRNDIAALFVAQENGEARELLSRIEALAKECERGVHLYLKFYGD